jgi:hypothetical protein
MTLAEEVWVEVSNLGGVRFPTTREAAARDERERCAKIAEDYGNQDFGMWPMNNGNHGAQHFGQRVADNIAMLIRRGQ